nr:hypothetical protein [Tanacetum cinerariifolium]
MSHASGSGDKVDIQSNFPNEQLQKVTGTNKGAGVRLEVLDVPKYDLESDEESWTFSQDEDDADEETDVNDDSEETKFDNDGNYLTHPNLSHYKADDEEEEEQKTDDDEVSSDQRVYSPPDYQLTDEEENQICGAILPNVLTNQEMLDSKAYKQYYDVASRAEPPKEKTTYKKKVYEPVTHSKYKSAPAAKFKRLKTPAKVTQSGKKR